MFSRSTEGVVPAIYDVYFTPGTSSWHDIRVRDWFSNSLDMQTGFVRAQPVSIQLLKKTPPDTRETEDANSTTAINAPAPPRTPQPAMARFGALLSPLAASHGQLLTQPNSSPVEVDEGATVQVVVAVAMPTPHQNHKRNSCEEEKQDNLHMPSEIALGVTKLTVTTRSDTV
jgi:hypothetical protein